MRRSLTLPMSPAEYRRLPPKLGWNYEYDGESAILTPPMIMIDVSRPVDEPVTTVDVNGLRIVPVLPFQAFALKELYFEAFWPSVEAVGLEEADIRCDAAWTMFIYASGGLGAPSPYSRCLVDGDRPIGALLVALNHARPRMQVLIVHPDYQRRGLAAALLREVCAAIAFAGLEVIHSRYMVANEPARSWYRKMGFAEQPSAAAVRKLRRLYDAQRSRLNGSGASGLRELEVEIERWEQLTSSIGCPDEEPS